MSGLKITHHAAMRLAQRALSPLDIGLILNLGTEVSDGYFMRDADARRATNALRDLIQHIERMRGKLAVTAGDRLVTAYPVSRKKQRRLLRRDP